MSATTTSAPVRDAEDTVVTSTAARTVLAITRLATGFIFLWAFLDKTFGLGFSTPAERAWINGGTPSQGFMSNLDPAKPFSGFFASIASPVTDWLFMLGMLGVGLAVMLGIGLRVSAVAGSIIMFLMWLAELPFVTGESAATNPIVDYHWVYALVLILAALTYAGDTWGLGKWWKSLEVVQNNRWLV